MAIKWKDVRDVLLLTTAHEDELVEAPSSRGAHSKIKPAVVLDYNKNKTGVDRSDQMLSYYTFSRMTVKWWKKLFFHLLDLAVVNAHILYKKSSKEKMSLEIFYEKVAEGLLASAGTEIQAVHQDQQPSWPPGWDRPFFYTEFQRHMVSRRGKSSGLAKFVQKKGSATREKL